MTDKNFKTLTIHEQIQKISHESLDVALEGVRVYLFNPAYLQTLQMDLAFSRLRDGIYDDNQDYIDLFVTYMTDGRLDIILKRLPFLVTFMPLKAVDAFTTRLYKEAYDLRHLSVFPSYYLSRTEVPVKDKLLFLKHTLLHTDYNRDIIKIVWTLVPEATHILIDVVTNDNDLPRDLPMLEILKKSIGENIDEVLKTTLTYLCKNVSAWELDHRLEKMNVDLEFLNRDESSETFLLEKILDPETNDNFANKLINALKNEVNIKTLALKTTRSKTRRLAFNRVIEMLGDEAPSDFVKHVIRKTNTEDVVRMVKKISPTSFRVEVVMAKICQTDSMTESVIDNLIDVVEGAGTEEELQDLALNYFNEIKRSISKNTTSRWKITSRMISFLKDVETKELQRDRQDAFKNHIDEHISYVHESGGGNTLWLLMPYINDMEWVAGLLEDYFTNVMTHYKDVGSQYTWSNSGYYSDAIRLATNYPLDNLYRQLDSPLKKRILALNSSNDEAKQYILSLEV